MDRISVVEHLERWYFFKLLFDEGAQVNEGQPSEKINERLAKLEL